jgi:hypothetical protein
MQVHVCVRIYLYIYGYLVTYNKKTNEINDLRVTVAGCGGVTRLLGPRSREVTRKRAAGIDGRIMLVAYTQRGEDR